MSDFVYHLLIIVVAALAVIRGYRRGMTGEVASVVAVCFGLICGRLFEAPVESWLYDLHPELLRQLGGECFLEMLAVGSVYIFIYFLLRMLLGILNTVGGLFSAGIVNSLIGATFSLLKYMMLLSILLNLIMDYNPHSSLVKFGNDRDGNVVELVLKLAPAALGVRNVEDLGHEVQLEEARTIS
ncbi:MAG: CvpA family protein [Muribaculaceae bacterium]|nr:CvpA family protein [Muribaculaceae bacterium]